MSRTHCPMCGKSWDFGEPEPDCTIYLEEAKAIQRCYIANGFKWMGIYRLTEAGVLESIRQTIAMLAREVRNGRSIESETARIIVSVNPLDCTRPNVAFRIG